jgi:hypothetical protein
MAPIEISDFRSDGVSLTPAAAPDFDARAQAILADYATTLLELKPYLAIVSNRNPRTVVAYTVAWTVTLRNGTSEADYTQFKFPDAVAGTGNGLSVLEGREMKSGDERLVGMGFEAWPPEYAVSYREFGLDAAARLGNVTSLRIALDAVIFDDGAMLGPDQSRLAENFIEFVHAKQTLYRDIVVGLENGDALEDVFAPLRQMLAVRGRVPYQDRIAGYRRQAATEILGFHNRVALEIFRRTLRREPFAIRRLSETSD